MNIVHQEGLAMPVDQELINIILNEAGNPPPHKAKITAVSLLFKDLSYSAEKGGYHPVEIRLISRNDELYFDYITDFSYQGLGQDAELCKELDFNFLDGEHYLQGWGPLPPTEAHELFHMWQGAFLAYAQLGFFTVTVNGD